MGSWIPFSTSSSSAGAVIVTTFFRLLGTASPFVFPPSRDFFLSLLRRQQNPATRMPIAIPAVPTPVAMVMMTVDGFPSPLFPPLPDPTDRDGDFDRAGVRDTVDVVETSGTKDTSTDTSDGNGDSLTPPPISGGREEDIAGEVVDELDTSASGKEGETESDGVGLLKAVLIMANLTASATTDPPPEHWILTWLVSVKVKLPTETHI